MSLQPPVIPVPPNAAPINTAELLTEQEVAGLLNIAVKTVQNWRWKGEGPRAVKLGKRAVRYRRADVEAFIEAGLTGEAA